MVLLDLKFFTGVPGLLISGGILLLVIALVIVIVTGKKGKKNQVVEEAPIDNNMQMGGMDPCCTRC